MDQTRGLVAESEESRQWREFLKKHRRRTPYVAAGVLASGIIGGTLLFWLPKLF